VTGLSRCFVGVWPSGDVRDALERRPRPEHPGVRWVPPEQWHVTLAFLGNAEPERVVDVLTGLDHPPVTAVVGTRVGRLGRGVLMAPVSGCEPLAMLVRTRVEGVGSWRETNAFLGHLTLARLKNVAACPWATPLEAPLSWAVNEVAVVISELTPQGSRYTTVATVPLIG
jgi:RNA 2',3'-cyclic 3'-phosphodiesterase